MDCWRRSSLGRPKTGYGHVEAPNPSLVLGIHISPAFPALEVLKDTALKCAAVTIWTGFVTVPS